MSFTHERERERETVFTYVCVCVYEQSDIRTARPSDSFREKRHRHLREGGGHQDGDVPRYGSADEHHRARACAATHRAHGSREENATRKIQSTADAAPENPVLGSDRQVRH